jgi:predicted nucleic acid-binding protein
VSAFADTSFLFAFYFPRAASEQAVAKVESSQDAPLISSLVRYEFQQAVWFKVWLQAQGQPLGLSETAAQSALAAFDLDVEQGLWVVSSSEWESVVTRAERLALDHTPRHGARAMDILHLAFALQLGATELLSFDENQRGVAQAEGLVASP